MPCSHLDFTITRWVTGMGEVLRGDGKIDLKQCTPNAQTESR